MASKLPPHWIVHDGQDCPVDPQSCPAVMFRRNGYGMRTNFTIQMGSSHAARWEDYGERNCWQWLPGSAEPMDIVAYVPDHGFVPVAENVRV